MQVNRPGGRPNVTQIQDKAQVPDRDNTQVTKNGGERVAVSSLSKLLAQVRAPEDAPDVAKVERLRDSIRVGEFKVDYAKTADTMVQEEA
jgi:flagellar biosynthesis anti-sigma factor FlgM